VTQREEVEQAADMAGMLQLSNQEFKNTQNCN
jgi:hypothetical protein